METKPSIFFGQNLETLETVFRKQPVEDKQQCLPEDHHRQNVLRFYGYKPMSQAASAGQPPEKKSKTNAVNGVNKDYVDNSNDRSDDEDVKECLKQCTPSRKAYLSEFVKFLRTKDAGSMTKKEALGHAHQVLSVMQEMDCVSDTIHCLLDRKRVSEWKQPLNEKRRSTRLLRRYLSSLEKFYIFLGSHRLSPQLASSLDRNVPHWIRKVHKLTHPRFGEKMMEKATAEITVSQTSTRGDPALGLVSSNENRLVCCGIRTAASTGQPPQKKSGKNADGGNGVNEDAVDSDSIRRRTAWNSEQELLVLYHFRTNPGKAAIRHKLLEVDELHELMNSEGVERIYEKVKSLHKKKRVITRKKMQERHAWKKEDVILLLNHFKNNPGKATIRRKLSEVEELRELINREGLQRIYEKVKIVYKRKM